MDLKSVDNFFFCNRSVRLWLENVGGLRCVAPSHIVIIYVITSKTQVRDTKQVSRAKIASLRKNVYVHYTNTSVFMV